MGEETAGNKKTAQKGSLKPGPGRPKGSRNKLTTTIRQAILDSFGEIGGKKWLKNLAKSDPKTYAQLLGKAMPTEISGVDGAPLAVSHTVGVDLSNISDEELDDAIDSGAQGRKAPKASQG